MRSFYYSVSTLLFILFWFSTLSVSAATIEEEQCMLILADYMEWGNNTLSFKGKPVESNLSEISLPSDEDITPSSSDALDLSNYETFKKFRLNEKFYKARRNNIGTILAEKNYIKSQVITFWEKKTDFEFPLQNGDGWKSEWDQITPLYNKLVYTHHLMKHWTFVSCGYFEIVPAKEGNYTWLSSEFYMTNGVSEGDSGFEIKNSNITKNIDGKDYTYLVGTSRVPWIGHDQNPLFYMNIITVAYDNGSKFFNEYQTFPLQVKAMTNIDSTAKNTYSVAELQTDFLDLVMKNTCLKIPHGEKSSLPNGCDDTFRAEPPSPKSANLQNRNRSLFSWIIPNTHAALDPSETENDEELPTSWALTVGGIPFALMQKLQAVPDKNFQAYLKTAVVPNIEEVFAYEKNNGEEWTSDYQEVFMACGIDYNERVEIVTEYLQNLDPNNWDVNAITWKNPRFWDCIVPYPDKTHLDQIIADSFESNKVAAWLRTGKLSAQAPSDQQYTPEQWEKIEKQQKLAQAYNEKVLLYSSQLSSGKISQEEYDTLINDLMLRKDAMTDVLLGEVENEGEKQTNLSQGVFLTWTTLIGGLLIILGLFILLFIVRRPKKN